MLIMTQAWRKYNTDVPLCDLYSLDLKVLCGEIYSSSPPHKYIFFFLLELDVWASLSRIMYVKSLKLEGCFHIHLLKVESFSALIENTSMICEITTSFEVYCSPVWNLGKCDVET